MRVARSQDENQNLELAGILVEANGWRRGRPPAPKRFDPDLPGVAANLDLIANSSNWH